MVFWAFQVDRSSLSLQQIFLYIYFPIYYTLLVAQSCGVSDRLHTPFLTVALFLIYSCLLTATCLLEIPCQTACSILQILLDTSASFALLTRNYLVSFYLAEFQTADIYTQIAPACTASNYLIVPTCSESHSLTSALLRSVLKKELSFLLLLRPLSIYLLKWGHVLNHTFCDTKL